MDKNKAVGNIKNMQIRVTFDIITIDSSIDLERVSRIEGKNGIEIDLGK